MKYKYYLSGAITDQSNFKEYFEGFAKRIQKYTDLPIFNPAENDMGQGAKWEDYMKYDIKELMESEILVLLPNWKKSKGAKIEIDICSKLDIPVMKFNKLIELLKTHPIKRGDGNAL